MLQKFMGVVQRYIKVLQCVVSFQVGSLIGASLVLRACSEVYESASRYDMASGPSYTVGIMLMMVVIGIFIVGVLVGYAAGLVAGREVPIAIAEWHQVKLIEPIAESHQVKLIEPMAKMLRVVPQTKVAKVDKIQPELGELSIESIKAMTKKQAIQGLGELKQGEWIASGMSKEDIERHLNAYKVGLDSYTVHQLRRLWIKRLT
jgi:hypothetical protein